MFQKAKGYPKLRGKAADIQGLDLALCKCFQHYMDPDNQQHVQASALLELNVEIGQILDSYSPKFGFMAVPQEQQEILVSRASKWRSCMCNFASTTRRLTFLCSTSRPKPIFAYMCTYFRNTSILRSLGASKGRIWWEFPQTSWRVACMATSIGMLEGWPSWSFVICYSSLCEKLEIKKMYMQLPVRQCCLLVWTCLYTWAHNTWVNAYLRMR